ncbi:MAG: carboxypeptidase-like regulatory domain-containing protein [Nannocystaceae bacterium]|nr:carboxypeptidase-like regulatory domain-containing protein [Nannocystaceae bacterium]
MACSPRTPPPPKGSAWIEGEVAGRHGARIFAFDKSDSRVFFAADSTADGRYRLGPLPAAEYEVRVMWTLAGPEYVDNFAVVPVTTTADTTSQADLTLPGTGSVVVRFAPDRNPRGVVTEVQLFTGSENELTMARYRELQEVQGHRPRVRDTISAADVATTFGGLPPGPYTACAVSTTDGDNLYPTCQDAEVHGAGPVEVTLDVRLG